MAKRKVVKRKTSKQIAASRRNIKKAQIVSARKRGRISKKQAVRAAVVVAIGAGTLYGARTRAMAKRKKEARDIENIRKWANESLYKMGANRTNNVTGRKATNKPPTSSSAGRKKTTGSKSPGYSPKPLMAALEKADKWLESTRSKSGLTSMATGQEHSRRVRQAYEQFG